ncbi:hypothetical protein ACFE04_023616 [Oxalis oulophora]
METSSFIIDNGGPRASHFLIAIFFAFMFVAARFLLDKFIFRRLAVRLVANGVPRYIKRKIIAAKEAKIVKCSESMWKLTYYATVEIFILAIIFKEPWFTDIKLYFYGWPNQHLKFPLKVVYMCQCGFYLYSIGALLAWETRRKDFAVMMSHHIITVILIGYSYITSFFRVGSIILALHDASDVFLEFAKVFKYSDKELGASICFGLFAISWFLLRLIFFPFWVIRATSYNLQEVLDLSKAYPTLLYYIFNTMLLMLLVFHVYWWVLIYAMIMKQLKNKGQVGEDIRSGKPLFLIPRMMTRCFMRQNFVPRGDWEIHFVPKEEENHFEGDKLDFFVVLQKLGGNTMKEDTSPVIPFSLVNDPNGYAHLMAGQMVIQPNMEFEFEFLGWQFHCENGCELTEDCSFVLKDNSYLL